MNYEKKCDGLSVSPKIVKHLPRDLPCTLFHHSRPVSAQRGVYSTTVFVATNTSVANRPKGL